MSKRPYLLLLLLTLLALASVLFSLLSGSVTLSLHELLNTPFADEESLQVQIVREIRLPKGNEPRVALACQVRLPDQNEIIVINLHFDWVKDDAFRYGQAKELAKYLGTLKLPYVLMGDFNDQPKSRTLGLFSQSSLEANKPEQDRFTFPATGPAREIDFIFAGPRESWKIHFTRVLNGVLTSDHRPVLSVVKLAP